MARYSTGANPNQLHLHRIARHTRRKSSPLRLHNRTNRHRHLIVNHLHNRRREPHSHHARSTASHAVASHAVASSHCNRRTASPRWSPQTQPPLLRPQTHPYPLRWSPQTQPPLLRPQSYLYLLRGTGQQHSCRHHKLPAQAPQLSVAFGSAARTSTARTRPHNRCTFHPPRRSLARRRSAAA
jgi:hypothetical protein